MRLAFGFLVTLSAAFAVLAEDYYEATDTGESFGDVVDQFVSSEIADHVHFLLYERGTNGYKELDINTSFNEQKISSMHFDPSKTTKVLIHGWLAAGTNAFCRRAKDAYMTNFDHNVISVDWSDMSVNLYSIARFSVNMVAPYVAKLFDYLQTEMGVSPDNIHVIGHSLGAHIAGMAGELMTQAKVGRITGLDPASPLFIFGKNFRLDKSDAQFVDVIHTSLIGFKKRIGHADFFPNGDKLSQPGCGWSIACTHKRAYEYFIESITSKKGFWAVSCTSWSDLKAGKCPYNAHNTALMGDQLSPDAKGAYYLRTASSSPFALGYNS